MRNTMVVDTNMKNTNLLSCLCGLVPRVSASTLLVTICLLFSSICNAQNDIVEIANRYRANGFISSISYDVMTLNPILSQDNISSNIIEHIFDGLVSVDEDGLPSKGGLAENWELSEEVYVVPNPNIMLPNGKQSNVTNLADYIKTVVQNNKVSRDHSISNIETVEIHNEENIVTRINDDNLTPPAPKQSYPKDSLTIKYPQRVKITLTAVDELFRKTLSRLLGSDKLIEFEENLVIIFNLKKGVLFHDGHEFDSKDVKFTYESVINPRNKSNLAHDFELVKNIDIVDKYKIKITYSALLSSALRSWTVGILPEHLLNNGSLYKEAIERGIDPHQFSMHESKFSEHPIGTGPYKLIKRLPNEIIILERNGNYFNGSPLLQNVVYLILPNSEMVRKYYKEGIIDYYSISYDQLNKFQENEGQYIFSGYSYSTTYIGYNPERIFFKDADIRRALSIAINYDEIITKLKLGYAVRTTGFYPINSRYYNNHIIPIQYNLQKAKKILLSKGWRDRDGDGVIEKDGNPFSFSIITNDIHRYEVLTYCKQYWKEIGIDVTIKFIEWNEFLKRMSNKNYDAFISGLTMAIEPDLYPVFHSSQTGPNQLNIARYRNIEADRIIELMRRTFNQEKQIEYAHKLQKIIYDDQPYTYLYVTKWYAALNKRIVIAVKDDKGKIIYRPIEQVKSGDISYDINKWIKLSE